MMSTVLVTGATGFVGRAVCRHLAQRGWHVRAACRRSSEELPGSEVFATGDLTTFGSWEDLLHCAKCVVHLANAAHVRRRSIADMEAARKLNVEATLRLAQAAAASGVKRFVYLSSAKVHGEETSANAYIETSSLSPKDPYAKLKAEAEAGLRRISADRSLQLVVLRPPLVYGPGVRANFLALIRLIAYRLPLPFAAIDNRRSLVYVGNLADAIGACLELPQAAGRTFLVTDGVPISTPALSRAIGTALGRPARLMPFPPVLLELAPPMRKLTRSLEVEDSAIRRDLGWTPPYTFEEGIRLTAEWYRAHGG